LGQGEAAAGELAAGLAIVEGKFKARLDRGTPVQGFWFDWAFAHILLRECLAGGAAPAPRPTG
jgi:eukaryotic-like serine/threonine-protein kinase